MHPAGSVDEPDGIPGGGRVTSRHAPGERPVGAAPLAGRTALVTGAGRGIGAGIARRLATDGAHVIVADRDLATAQAIAAGIAEAGGSSVAVRMDVTNEQDRQDAFGEAEATGGLGILVNNAGTFTAQPLLDVDSTSWKRVFDVNVQGLFFCCQAGIPSMVARGHGRIINLSSTAARIGNPMMLAYNASKAAVLAITRGIALEYGRHGITANSVLPGIIDTPMWAALDTDVAPLLGFAPGTLMADRVARIPIGRAGTPTDVAAMVAFLASDEAAYITGQALHVDGGLSMP